MSDRLEDTPTPETAEASPDTAASETADVEAAEATETAETAQATDAASETAAASSEPEAESPSEADTPPEAVVAEASADAPPETETATASEAAAEAAEPETEAAVETAGGESVVEAAESSETATSSETAESSETVEMAAQTPAEAASAETEPETATAAESETPVAETAEAPTAEAGAEDAAAEAKGEIADTPAESVEAAKAETSEEPAKGAEAAKAEAPETKAEMSEEMAELQQAMEAKKEVKGQVIGWNKGGYHVALGKIAAFCPVSQIEIGNPRGPKRYLDKTFSFHIIEIQNGGRRVVLSRSAAIKAEREQRAALVRELLKPGAELDGKISSLTNFGAFVDLGGGIEGLVHVSEISRRRIEHPKETLKSGQKVRVSVLKIEKGGQRISLSMKRLEPDPWKGVAERFPAGSQFTGTILRQADFGLFVEVEPGLEGLVHTSRLALGKTLADESFEVGQEVSGWVHEVESKRRRLSLSLREIAGGNPWQGVTERYPVGELAKGTVERLASFGVFIELEPGLTGLLPFSVLGGSAAGNPRRQFHVGKEVSIRVLAIDRDTKRISLGTEGSKAEGNQQDYREYVKSESRRKESGGMNAMAAAFAKLKEREGQQVQ